MGFSCHPRRLDHWMATKTLFGHYMTDKQKQIWSPILWRLNVFLVAIQKGVVQV